MRSAGDPYGWGVFSVPMPHETGAADPAGLPLYRLLTRDIPWRAVGLSLLLTFLMLAAALWFGLRKPAPLVRTEPPPVEVTVMLPAPPPPAPPAPVATPPVEPAPAPPPKVQPPPVEPPKPAEPAKPVAVPKPVEPPKPVVPPKPLEPPKPVARPEPIPPPEPVMARRPAVQPKPQALPKPAPVQVKPQAEPLPRPTQLAQAAPRRQTPSPAALPKRQTEVGTTSTPTLSVAPSVEPYADQRPATAAAVLPQQAAGLRSDAPAVALDVQPAARQVARRAADQPALPQSTTASFAGPATQQLAAVDTGLAQTRYARPQTASQLPDTPRQQAVTAGRSGTPAVAVPQTSGLQADLTARPTSNSAPAMQQSTVALARQTGAETLSGPAAAVTPTNAAPDAALKAEGSYDFLDLVGPADLDPSVLISLNRLNTCRDPGEETQLKTRLAVVLNQPGLCRSGGVVFDIRNPESAYSIHIDLYNYAQREFRDRCDALRLAVQSCTARR